MLQGFIGEFLPLHSVEAAYRFHIQCFYSNAIFAQASELNPVKKTIRIDQERIITQQMQKITDLNDIRDHQY